DSFNKYDFDKSGAIDVDELTKLFDELNWAHDEKSVKIALASMDADNSGTIEFDEFKKWAEFAYSFRILKPANPIATGSRLSLVNEYDTDDDGSLSECSIPDFTEFNLMGEYSDKSPEDVRLMVLKNAFDAIDTDKSGSIETGELEALFKEINWRYDAAHLEGAMRALDSDNSGSIEWEEFKKWSDFAYNYRVLAKQSVASKNASNQFLHMSEIGEVDSELEDE
ncbi:hypothetical protein SARC_02508, partial [Sphaeroforma arctica JP610]